MASPGTARPDSPSTEESSKSDEKSEKTTEKTMVKTEVPSDKKSEKTTEKSMVKTEALRKELAAVRENISVTRTPVTALSLFSTWAWEFSVWLVGKILRSPVTWLLVLPATVSFGAAKYHFAPGLFVPPVCGEAEPGVLWRVELAAKEVAWWTILGILSSVGFGTGLHSGLMFLFPHVMQVVGAAEGCGTSSGLVGWYHHPCKLDCSTTHGPKDGSTLTILRLWAMVTVQCMLWGFGTAIGELPPYLISKAARLAGSKDSEYEAELEEARQSTDVFSRMKMWTIDFTEKHGFFGVFMLASWPNAAFDMCGMCCGYVLMPFWTFFLACALGKGVVKVNLQALFFVILFGSQFFQVFLALVDGVDSSLAGLIGKDLKVASKLSSLRSKLVKQFEQQSRFLPGKLFVGKGESLDNDELFEVYEDKAVADRVMTAWDADLNGEIGQAELQMAASVTDGKISLGALDPGAPTSFLKMCWEFFIFGLILYFVFSAVTQVARSKQAELDEAKVKELEKQEAGKKD